MVGRHSHVSGAVLEHSQKRVYHATKGADFEPLGVLYLGHGEVVPEEFVGAVD